MRPLTPEEITSLTDRQIAFLEFLNKSMSLGNTLSRVLLKYGLSRGTYNTWRASSTYFSRLCWEIQESYGQAPRNPNPRIWRLNPDTKRYEMSRRFDP